MINTRYLEKILIVHPLVKEVCVVPASREDTDYRFHAFVTLINDDAEVVYAFQNESLELLEGLDVRIEVLPELPKSGMGRISREALRLLCDEIGV